ncbi:MAG: type I secretion system permease/ATPase, partial [Alphaproteobacteria bacterium]
ADLDEGGTAQLVLPDSGGGERRVALAELDTQYMGYALFARPEARMGLGRTESRHDEPDRERPRSWFWGTLWTFWPIYAEVALGALLINLFALASPLFIMNVYDRVVPNNATATLWVLAVGVAVVFGFEFALRILRSYFADVAGRGADTIIASRMFEQVMGVKLAARPKSMGALVNHLREFETLRDFFTSATLTTLIDLPFVLLFVGMIWLVGGPIAWIPLLAAPLVFGVGLLTQLPLERLVRRSFADSARKHGILFEAVGGLETIKAMGAEGRMQRGWERYVGASAATGVRLRGWSTFAVSFATLAQNLVTVAIVLFGVYRIGDGDLSMGGLIACTILASRTMAPLGQIAAIATRLQHARAALGALDKIMGMPVERPADRSFLHRPSLEGEIEFKDVVFGYPGQPAPVLNGVSFRVAAGERVGLIGRVGSGKSTLGRLVLGLYEPVSGSVLVDGTDVRQVDPADLRRNIGSVPQEIYLFSGTVRDNIAFSAAEADDPAVLRAARIAGVDDFIRLNPAGYDLAVGERGDALSGGQRQAIALARGLAAERPVLVLDEPTNAMDANAENQFKARLMEILPGKTLLLMTHRYSLLSLVERLILIDGGKVVADGPRDKVLERLAGGREPRAAGAESGRP